MRIVRSLASAVLGVALAVPCCTIFQEDAPGSEVDPKASGAPALAAAARW